MKADTTPTETGILSCELCLREIPPSEAQSEEATEYVMYFWGLDCYAEWKARRPHEGDRRDVT
jgi:hypothetical protein